MTRMLSRHTGFTLIELLVVVAIIVALIAILLPSLNKAIEVAQRAQCASNQHQISIASLNYTAENNGLFIITRGREVTHTFAMKNVTDGTNLPGDGDVDWVEQWARLGLMGAVTDTGVGFDHYEPGEVWDCPSRTDFAPQYIKRTATAGVFLHEYQYFGGIMNWRNPFGLFASRSPVRLSNTRGGWALTADTTMKIDGAWGGGNQYFRGMPSHRDPGSDTGAPLGHNQGTVDGAVQWVDYNDLIYIHSWNSNWSRVAMFYQQDLGDYEPPVGATAEALR